MVFINYDFFELNEKKHSIRLGELIDILKERWNTDYGKLKFFKKKNNYFLILVTGGWHENEELVEVFNNAVVSGLKIKNIFLTEWKAGGIWKYVFYEPSMDWIAETTNDFSRKNLVSKIVKMNRAREKEGLIIYRNELGYLTIQIQFLNGMKKEIYLEEDELVKFLKILLKQLHSSDLCNISEYMVKLLKDPKHQIE